MKVLVAGSSGFVGGLVTPELLQAGHEVVGLGRSGESSPFGIRVVRGDIAAGGTWHAVLEGVDVAYYLVHSFEGANREGFAVRDRRAATAFAQCARQAGVSRIVYLGVSDASDTARRSAHRASRAEVESILLSALPASVVLRTWMIVSARNQFIRFLADLIRERQVLVLPPSCVFRFRPVDGRDMGAALAAAATAPELAGKVVDLVGPSLTTTEDFCMRLMDCMGVRRRILRLPFSPPTFVLARLIRSAGLDPAMILPVFESARAGDVSPQDDTLNRLVPSPRTLDESLAHTVRTLSEPAHTTPALETR